MTETQKIDCIIVNDNGSVYFRTSTVVFENGNSVDYKVAQMVVNPGDDYLSQPDEVQQACAAAHTPQVIEAFKNAKVVIYDDAI
jgi:hypothetical protein